MLHSILISIVIFSCTLIYWIKFFCAYYFSDLIILENFCKYYFSEEDYEKTWNLANIQFLAIHGSN